MEGDTVVRLPRPGASVTDDPRLEVLRSGARRMLQEVIEAEVEAFLGAHGELEDAHGRRRVVRNGHAPEREIQTGIGPISVRRPKLHDRDDGWGGERIPFTSKMPAAVLAADEERRGSAEHLHHPSRQILQIISFGEQAAFRKTLKTNERGLDPSPARSANFGRR